MARRLDSVLQSLYLLFNEGYKASSGDKLVREELCEEAIRLTELLAQHPAGNQPKTHALLALMLLNAARNPAREDEQGNLLRLEEQDRTRWDKSDDCARNVVTWANRPQVTSSANIIFKRASPPVTRRPKIINLPIGRGFFSLYDRLMEFDHSPVVALNRAVAVANIHGPKAGLEAVAKHSQIKETEFVLSALCCARRIRNALEPSASRCRTIPEIV